MGASLGHGGGGGGERGGGLAAVAMSCVKILKDLAPKKNAASWDRKTRRLLENVNMSITPAIN